MKIMGFENSAAVDSNWIASFPDEGRLLGGY
jgi:hypothetical protein